MRAPKGCLSQGIESSNNSAHSCQHKPADGHQTPEQAWISQYVSQTADANCALAWSKANPVTLKSQLGSNVCSLCLQRRVQKTDPMHGPWNVMLLLLGKLV